jgi:predicted nucleic acid-binding Zn ribbon protein
MKFCNICVRDIDIDNDRIPFQCGEKLPENEERKKEKHEIEPDKKKPKVLNLLK